MSELFLKRSRGEISQFKRMVVETTGLADPAPILHTLMIEPELSKQFCIGGVVTTVDAVNGLDTLDRHPEAVKQVAVADRLLLTKTDLAAPDALARRLHDVSPSAERIVVRHGAIDAAALLHITPVGSRLDNVLAWLGDHDACDHDHHDHHHGIQTYSFVIDRPVEWSALARWFEYVTALKGADLLRMKGLINVAGSDRPLVVHGVQHVIHPPVRLDAWPSDDRRTRLVFIVRDIPRAAIERTLAKFACIDAGGSDGPPKASAMVRETGRSLEVTP
jgi:G3E family GTPase